MNNAHVSTGGFQSQPLPPASTTSLTATGNPDVISTSQAIEMFLAFGNKSTDFTSDATWILDQKAADGGFRFSTTDSSESMTNAYYSCKALNATAKLSSLGTAVNNYILGMQNTTTGGFGDVSVNNVTLLATYYAIDALYLLNNETSINSILKSVQNFTNYCNNSNNGFGIVPGAPSSLEATWAGVSVLTILAQVSGESVNSIEPSFNATATLAYVNGTYFSNANDTLNYGGYGTTTRADIMDTAYALLIYSILKVTDPYATQAQSYLLGCQNAYDGGFADVSSSSSAATQSSMMMTYFAFKGLQAIDSTLADLNGEAFDLAFNWIPLIVIAAVAAVLIGIGVWYRKTHRD
jgi:prenyltransferase beta subunit